MSVSVIKLSNIYKNSSGEEMNVFMITSGSELVDKYDFILDYTSKETTPEILQKFLNVEVYKNGGRHEDRMFDVDRFLYRMRSLNPKDPVSNFLREIHRNITIKNILSDEEINM